VISNKTLDVWFDYHAPTEEQRAHYEALRAAAKRFAKSIRMHTPPGPDQTTAFRKLRETLQTANAAVACHVEEG